MRPHNSTIAISCKGATATSQVGDTVRIKFFADTNEVNGAAHHAHPFDRRVRNIERSMHNGRQQDGVRAEYVKSTKMRGIVENVRGEAWMQQRSSDLVNGTDSKCASFFALSFASLTEATKISCSHCLAGWNAAYYMPRPHIRSAATSWTCTIVSTADHRHRLWNYCHSCLKFLWRHLVHSVCGD